MRISGGSKSPTKPTQPKMSVAIPDPDETDVSALDDRNLEIDPDFEMDETLAYTAGFGGRDPADEGGF